MTSEEREEAIAILHNMEYDLSNQVGSKYCRKKYEAVKMSIKALEQESCEDAISRQAVIKGIAEWVSDGYADSEADISHISSLATHLPPVTPQPKTGHWIKYGKLYQCSECKELSCCQGKFCNECGTKMVEPQESEE